MTVLNRIKTAGRVLLGHEARKKRHRPIPAITRREVAQIKRFFPRDKFFIFGHARSGTTLLTRLVRLHAEVHCNDQAHFFTRRPLLTALVDSPEVEEWLSRKSNRWNHGQDLSAVMLRAAAEYVMEREAAAAGKPIVGDKSPSSTIHGQAVRDLHLLFPEAKLVYIVRDGRDVLTSERFRNLVEESRYLGGEDRKILRDLRSHPDRYITGGSSIFTESMIRRVSQGWFTNVAEIDAEGNRLFGKRFMAVRYEDLLGDPFACMTRLWGFLGVSRIPNSLSGKIKREMRSNPDEEWQAKRGEELAAFLTKGQAGNWRRLFTDRDKRLFKDIAGPMLIKWKYEQSDDW